MSDDLNPKFTDNLDSAKECFKQPCTSAPSPDQKLEISRWIADGMGLSDVQKKINQDFGIVMTYMDVRFLVDDLNLELVEKEEPAPKNPDPSDDLDAIVEEPSTGGVTIDVDGVTPPGAMASGSVIFSDGESKKWSIDQFGRLAMTGGTEGYKPSDEDIMEFQKQLESTLRGPTL